MKASFPLATGRDALALAESDSTILLWKYADPTEDARIVTLDEAREIVRIDPSLIATHQVVHVAHEGEIHPLSQYEPLSGGWSLENAPSQRNQAAIETAITRFYSRLTLRDVRVSLYDSRSHVITGDCPMHGVYVVERV